MRSFGNFGLDLLSVLSCLLRFNVGFGRLLLAVIVKSLRILFNIKIVKLHNTARCFRRWCYALGVLIPLSIFLLQSHCLLLFSKYKHHQIILKYQCCFLLPSIVLFRVFDLGSRLFPILLSPLFQF